MPKGRASEPGPAQKARIAKAREEAVAARAAKPGVAAPPPKPFVSPEVEVLIDRLTGYKKGEIARLEGHNEGSFQALIEAGAIRLAKKRPSVAAMKEDNDG